MVEPVRHRQTKEAATDMFSLQPPRHISTLPNTGRITAPRRTVEVDHQRHLAQPPHMGSKLKGGNENAEPDKSRAWKILVKNR